MFQNVDAYAGDPILSLMEAFQQDPRADKVNLSIGLYYNEQAIIPQLEAVRQAADRLQSQLQKASLYLPMEGLAPYRRAVQTLLFGEHHPALRAGRIATIQTLGGSGALKVGADFLKRYFPDSAVWVSDPTWENHVAIFCRGGLRGAYLSLVRQGHPRGQFPRHACRPPAAPAAQHRAAPSLLP
ncbi:aromatic amino acid aminotransferase [Klebsiella pneumoniae]|uniref:Aromatic amino acid aminotransferase n=1 Tax=Klebsiella pneumoniae TaxID=573 RepID=A0A2X3EG79_KLEPN|nr:aromatic amino acid aminotransferase [Klebsiella pneumoniae]